MLLKNTKIIGLSQSEVLQSRVQNGMNVSNYKKENGFLEALKSIVKEPMVLLLFVAATIYFISGKYDDGLFLAAAIVIVAAISLFQDSRSRNALEKLKDFTQPFCKVIRDGEVLAIKSEELVIGDFLMVEEGTLIAADGKIVQSNDFSVNESILTGESFSVAKDLNEGNNQIFQGTLVSSGLAIAEVNAIGNKTQLGLIGKSLEQIEEEKTPLQLQINSFVKKMVFIGAIVFLIVLLLNYYSSRVFLDSLLKALTLAMSILPEEIPVAFTTFMAIGAWRLMKMGIVVKQMKTVETLGSATVICTDKTGTITENRMSIASIYAFSANRISSLNDELNKEEKELVELAMWASEPIPFDPMEVEIHNLYVSLAITDLRKEYSIFHEYPLEGKPPMMTHIFQNEKNDRIIAAKGAPEAILHCCSLEKEELEQIKNQMHSMANSGFRLLAVAETKWESDDFPATQQEFQFEFKGIIAFYDPPKKHIQHVLSEFYKAGIKVKIVTGDNELTTQSIAREVGFQGHEKSISGKELMALSDQELKDTVMNVNVYTRMFPEAKLRIINALKGNQQIVAMTGDGVNDGPALKAAHIGIAMGKKGTEIAKQAASLILIDDDLSKMVDAVAMGRRIYTNLKKAIQYIISIHIPIILTVFVPLALAWTYPNLFSPIHIIFLELIMGPTCSIIYENEPMEKNVMSQAPRPLSVTFFNWSELMISIVQGLVITAGTLFVYQMAVQKNFSEEVTRTMVFTTLVISNIVLTLCNRSFYYSIFTTLRYRNNMVPIIIFVTYILMGMLIFVPPMAIFFGFDVLDPNQLLACCLIGIGAVIWFEGYKWLKRIKF
ncbi:MAG: cation-translocating P-type ATPase [Saprospiraceae bacterium]